MAFQDTIVSNGLSDFHKLFLTLLKTRVTKSKPQKITYGYYKNFNSVRLNEEFKYVYAKQKLPLALSLMKYFYKN